MPKPDILVVSGLDVGDITFSCERGTWNISRALRDCEADKHKLWLLDVTGLYDNNSGVEVDEAKVAMIAELINIGALDVPLISVEEDGKLWLIDGHHRLRAMHRLGHKEALSFVIEDAKPYIVRFNGSRHAPFPLY